MPVGKKLVVAVSLLAAGVSTALFFRKDASHSELRHEAGEEFDFRERVERRVTADAERANPFGTRRTTLPKAKRALPVPAAATAAIAEPGASPDDSHFAFHKSSNPVGALLEPLGIEPLDEPAEKAPTAAHKENRELEDSPALTHKVVDGDTLSRLATRYLGRGDRYLEIFELNRGVLASPDLLPIGLVLRIPAQGGTPAGGATSQREWSTESPLPHLENVPARETE